MSAVDNLRLKAGHYLSQIDKELGKHPVAVQFEKSTHVPKAYAAFGAASLLLILLFFNVAGPLLTNMLGWLYPAWASFRALETKAKTDDTHWLTYWVIFGFMSTLEYFSWILLYYMPFYYVLKAAFLVWLYLPQTAGAHYCYTTIFRPYLRSKTTFVDSTAAKAREKVSSLSNAALKELDAVHKE